ncbi:MAG: hypothetical protein KJZ84_23065 [Bryobacteraceae bacterium]|nr:hypothetical protein [Bryobacteraceae bacterium]
MTLPKCALTVLCGLTLFGQSSGGTCPLDSAENGDVVKLRGEAFSAGHDTFIRPTACAFDPANRVILVWADDPLLSTNKASVRRDADFTEFTRLLKATFRLPPNAGGIGQARYRVFADFEGRLEVAPSTGLKRDPRSKKVVRLEGFGHPMPFTRFRLVATGVSRIESEEQSVKPDAKEPK